MPYFGKPVGAFVGLLGVAGVSLDAGTFLLIVGAVIYALAVWRSKSQDVLRRENADLRERNRSLESEKVELVASNASLKAQPNLNEHARILREVAEIVRDIKQAVVPPPYIRDDD